MQEKTAMTHYECTFIARQDLSKADVEKIADQLAASIEKAKGKVVKREYWGLKALAYEINKNRRGHYMMLGLDAGGAAIDALRHELRINEDILRSLEVKVEKLDSKPSVMAQRADEAA
jgi:small subunit ribosomal protein S6